jgi:hypothetical protein
MDNGHTCYCGLPANTGVTNNPASRNNGKTWHNCGNRPKQCEYFALGGKKISKDPPGWSPYTMAPVQQAPAYQRSEPIAIPQPRITPRPTPILTEDVMVHLTRLITIVEDVQHRQVQMAATQEKTLALVSGMFQGNEEDMNYSE